MPCERPLTSTHPRPGGDEHDKQGKDVVKCHKNAEEGLTAFCKSVIMYLYGADL